MAPLVHDRFRWGPPTQKTLRGLSLTLRTSILGRGSGDLDSATQVVMAFSGPLPLIPVGLVGGRPLQEGGSTFTVSFILYQELRSMSTDNINYFTG